ncbi:MAG TPA: hypothetical protein PK624_02065 [Spirochaetota bacterium]|nr:hypothetical protein [Spirochaetota bacterium]HOF32691.1 hypothetical protein [Spirochaetota bacterium]HOR43561.1 hypothetical protein [Spirochaetota bacterium]HPK55721.1 hypothetical protein [Spirochaetota bacterium]
MKILLTSAFLLLTSTTLFSENIFIFNSSNIIKITKMNPIEKDKYILSLQKNIISAKVVIESVEENTEYKRAYRITSTLINSNQTTFIFHIYSEKKDYIDLMKKGDIFEFKGQMVLCTPLNTKRDKYIIDVILQDGAMVFE